MCEGPSHYDVTWVETLSHRVLLEAESGLDFETFVMDDITKDAVMTPPPLTLTHYPSPPMHGVSYSLLSLAPAAFCQCPHSTDSSAHWVHDGETTCVTLQAPSSHS